MAPGGIQTSMAEGQSCTCYTASCQGFANPALARTRAHAAASSTTTCGTTSCKTQPVPIPQSNSYQNALEAWRIWAVQKSGLSDDDLALCAGPELSIGQFDRANIGNSTFACMRVEDAKFARDSCVLTKSDGKCWAGHVCAFLSHTPPGYEDCAPHLEADVAEVVWFAEAVPAEGITDGASNDLQCPVFKRAWQDDPTGNLWPVDRLAPCKLASVPHSSHPHNLVLVTRFATDLKQVPTFLGC